MFYLQGDHVMPPSMLLSTLKPFGDLLGLLLATTWQKNELKYAPNNVASFQFTNVCHHAKKFVVEIYRLFSITRVTKAHFDQLLMDGIR